VCGFLAHHCVNNDAFVVASQSRASDILSWRRSSSPGVHSSASQLARHYAPQLKSYRGTELRAAPPEREASEWFEMNETFVRFGAESILDVPLSGSPDLANDWLLGNGPGDDSIERLLKAARPVGADIMPGVVDEATGISNFKLALPNLELLGLGHISSSVTVWGVRRETGGPSDPPGAHLEIGSNGSPQVNIYFSVQEISLDTFGLDVCGELAISEKKGKGRAVGWASIKVQSDLPTVMGMPLPEDVLRTAAREVCKNTVSFATRSISDNLAQDFSAWRTERVRIEREEKRAAAKVD